MPLGRAAHAPVRCPLGISSRSAAQAPQVAEVAVPQPAVVADLKVGEMARVGGMRSNLISPTSSAGASAGSATSAGWYSSASGVRLSTRTAYSYAAATAVPHSAISRPSFSAT